MSRLRDSLIIGVIVLATTGVARADGTSKSALAEGLFQEAKKLLAAGKTSAACEKFKASLDVERESGTLTALAFCHQKEGRTASAWAEYTEVAVDAKRAGKAEQERYVRTQIAELEKVLRYVNVKVTSVPELRVTIDDVPLPTAALGTSIPVDPGARTFAATAPKRVAVKTTVQLAPGPGTTEIELPPLVEEVAPAPPKPPPSKPAPVQTSGGSRVWLGLGVVAAGAGAVAFGSYLQFVVAARQQDNAVFLMRTAYDEPGARGKHDDAVTSSAFGLTAIGAGAVAIGAGAYLALTSRRESPSARVVLPWVGSGTAGVVASSAF